MGRQPAVCNRGWPLGKLNISQLTRIRPLEDRTPSCAGSTHSYEAVIYLLIHSFIHCHEGTGRSQNGQALWVISLSGASGRIFTWFGWVTPPSPLPIFLLTCDSTEHSGDSHGNHVPGKLVVNMGDFSGLADHR